MRGADTKSKSAGSGSDTSGDPEGALKPPKSNGEEPEGAGGGAGWSSLKSKPGAGCPPREGPEGGNAGAEPDGGGEVKSKAKGVGAGETDGALARPAPGAIGGARKSNKNGVGVGGFVDPDARGPGFDGTGEGAGRDRGPPPEAAGGAGLGAGDGPSGAELVVPWFWAGSPFFTSWRWRHRGHCARTPLLVTNASSMAKAEEHFWQTMRMCERWSRTSDGSDGRR